MLAAVARLLTVSVALLALLAAACGGSGGEQGDSTPDPAPDRAAAPTLDANGCTPAEEPPKKTEQLSKPKTKLDPSKTYVATIVTNCGTFEITLDVKRAPKTSASFKHIADAGLYDGTMIHRIVPNFVIQGGDPSGDGTGGPGYKIREKPPRDLKYTQGVVAMAKGGTDPAGTSGSQFFVVTGPDAEQLPPDYALLGKVTGGEDVVEKIGSILTDPRTDRPDAPVVMESVEVTES
jgi:peptidyl-prolyl cis-trans isomerase B (cyclophilin B)